jgi:hypothetical protein
VESSKAPSNCGSPYLNLPRTQCRCGARTIASSKYKRIAQIERIQGAGTVHFSALICAKSSKMWRIQALLFRYPQAAKLSLREFGFTVLSVWRLANFVLLCLLVGLGTAQQTPISTVVVKGPTIIAFFEHVTDSELENHPDTNEVLGDFQLYASQAGPRLKNAGIVFQVVSNVRFRIKDGATAWTFSARKVPVGYYFIAPGKPAHVEYGVRTDDDLLAAARKYFQLPVSAP